MPPAVMDSVAENAPSIIEAAAQSTLGILALLILTVGVIAYLFFGKSSDRIKVVIFSMIFVGMAGFGLVILSQASAGTQPGPAPPGPVVNNGGGGGSDDPGPDPGGDDPPDEPDPPPANDRTQVTLTYAGDLYNCELDLEIGIGDRTFQPQTNLFQATDLLEGRQPYEIAGVITCPMVGVCEARGQGTLDVEPNAVYGLSWQNTEYGVCDVVLHRG